MRIRISLEYLLSKNKMTFKEFLEKNNLNSYEAMDAYCDRRNIISPDQDYYSQHAGAKAVEKKAVVKEKVGAKDVKSKQPEKGTVSQTQKKQTSRSRTRKVKKS